ncbi:MAG: efflux RND transporter periplasmic adaptor subunit, partial [Candidatus Delongbacteria bacterium]|nr:efflux RND transporter periplasmic adaptor subunit [Candidatus Delongbacteria bacterium]
KAIITVDNSEENFIGIVSYVSPEAEMMSGTFSIEITINNDSNLLKHNQFARISLITQSSSNTIVIPQKSVLKSSYVFVAANGIAEKRKITLGIGNEYEIEIMTGIAEGEEVIVSGNIGLQAGDKIEIRN